MMDPLMNVKSVLVHAAIIAAAVSVAAVGSVLADSVPQIPASGPLYTAFVQIRPYIAILLFAYGIYAIFHYAYHAGRVRLHKVANGGLEGEAVPLPSISGFLSHIGFVVVMIALLMAVMFAGLDVFNALLKFIWSMASTSVLSA